MYDVQWNPENSGKEDFLAQVMIFNSRINIRYSNCGVYKNPFISLYK